MRGRFTLLGMLVALSAGGVPGLPVYAIYWNNDPAFGVASASGLTDRAGWFQNTYVLQNSTNNSRGTTTLLNSEWAITVRHVVQNGGDYGQIAFPGSVYIDVGGVRYYAEEIFTPDGGSEMALLHLRDTVPGALDATGIINTSFDETGRYVEIGGYGYWGIINTTGAGGTVAGTANGSATFHRAYNVPWVPGQIQIAADGENLLENLGLLEGIAGPGDSGGPMLGYYGRGTPTADSMTGWRLIGLTATSAAGTGGAAWGNVSNYTRVAAYSNWINSTLATAFADPEPSSTQPWTQVIGSGLVDTGGDRFEVKSSNAAPVFRAAFGPDGDGFTLDSEGDKISFSAIVDTPMTMGNIQFRYGMYDDAGGTINGTIAGGTPWNGYFVGNAVEGSSQGVYEKGPNGGGVGQFWSLVNPNTATAVGTPTSATGTFDDGGGSQLTPAARYELQLDYTRVGSGLTIDWSMVSVDPAGDPNGVYSHTGSVFDPTPASSSWNYNQIGLFLFGGGTNGTIIVDDIAVSFTDMSDFAADFNHDGMVDATDLGLWQMAYGTTAVGDADGDGDSDGDDFLVWQREFGSGVALLGDSHAVPEPVATALIMSCGFFALTSWRSRFVNTTKPRLMIARASAAGQSIHLEFRR